MIIKTILSISSIIFSLIMIYLTQINYKKKYLNKLSYLLWVGIWALIIFVSLRPNSIDDYFINNFKIDVFYILSVISIITLVILYYISQIKINILEKKINKLIRAESLKDILNKIKDE
tara:strand:- start:1628 stop:1981 length:354 start_codon:yes stop_codon:yes gene_type:complete